QVTSYLDRNGIWNGKKQTLVNYYGNNNAPGWTNGAVGCATSPSFFYNKSTTTAWTVLWVWDVLYKLKANKTGLLCGDIWTTGGGALYVPIGVFLDKNNLKNTASDAVLNTYNYGLKLGWFFVDASNILSADVGRPWAQREEEGGLYIETSTSAPAENGLRNHILDFEKIDVLYDVEINSGGAMHTKQYTSKTHQVVTGHAPIWPWWDNDLGEQIPNKYDWLMSSLPTHAFINQGHRPFQVFVDKDRDYYLIIGLITTGYHSNQVGNQEVFYMTTDAAQLPYESYRNLKDGIKMSGTGYTSGSLSVMYPDCATMATKWSIY
ncbi:MAG: hypothetical protein MJ151_01625, partial [Lachnospiraceae bacterium]|nr:hypothetical protein [Lachnospiraceae bacterium]